VAEGKGLVHEAFDAKIKGFEQSFKLWRVKL
jgi:hypothetical protein